MTIGNEHRSTHLFGVIAQHDRAGSTAVKHRCITS
jgi:hypothetical protein